MIATARRGQATARAAGAVVGMILAAIVLYVQARRTPAQPAVRSTTAGGRLVAEDAGPLREVLVHYVAELEPIFAASYRDFLGTLSEETRIVFVVRRGERPSLEAFVARIGSPGAIAARMRVVELDVPIGIWSKDRALVLAPRDGATKTALLVPPRPRHGETSRPGDWDIVPAVVSAMPDRFELRVVPFAFDAGDFTVAGDRVLFDVNLFRRNRGRGVRSPAELHARLRTMLGREVVMLGTDDGDVPRHHMSMYAAVLDGKVALVGDPERGASIVGTDFAPGETSPETGEALRGDFSPETRARFDHAASDLARAGFRVVRIPTVAFDDRTYFAYTNGVYETRAGKRIAWVPRFDVPALDRAAYEVYAGLGWTVIPVAVRAAYPHHGTIGCMVNVLARGS